MEAKRRQGRPKRGDQEVGFSFILQRARAAMVAKPFDLSSRKELSAAAGVTPALISYYFPREVNIADLILSPVILLHLQNMTKLASAEQSAIKSATSVAIYLISALRKDKNIFNAYVSLVNGASAPKENFIRDMQQVISKMMERPGITSLYPMPVRHGAFWGMCVAAAALDDDLQIEDLRTVFASKVDEREPGLDESS